ncbi:MAG: hypothetical protein AUJ52_04770 [Elusimicrobia bacterium CG1_02_63_36]|nr:MAG: hypothetical protein AUJ52_04770 [Elusimicrobia bacterium CG1_02_63_36]PIP82728.1 MAG: hypothetical protein COR54_13300 [Elusimicrobia bacterium CG22_combo_CG10-13_8_21_14_all_63_91]PJA11971.1 MAG: hypothetical protein COX66_18485 [Elusimicrobia bacterium CG_4_10_14_0_2_um_filter_63_34]PJB23784.1 MAG: hypothetical protein CO113_16855 [Elusimicrobia bacterium CG_4_9_14_3_um_filter_62_55]
MDWLRIGVSAAELLVTIVMAVLTVFVVYRALIKTNTDFDEDDQIIKGNLAVGLLVGALLLAAANMMHQAFKPVADTVHMALTNPLAKESANWKLGLYSIANLGLAFFIVVTTLSFSLRLFGRLTRAKDTRPGKELFKGNVAIGVILSSFVLVISLFVGEGVKALTKALVPRPNVGRMMIME